LVGGARIDDGADDDEAALGEILLEGVPVGDGAAAGGIVGAEEEDELDLAGVVGGFDFAGEFGGEVFQDEVGDGRGGAEIDGGGLFLAAAGGRQKNQEGTIENEDFESGFFHASVPSASWKAGGGSFLGLMIFSFRNFSSWRTRLPSPVASFL